MNTDKILTVNREENEINVINKSSIYFNSFICFRFLPKNSKRSFSQKFDPKSRRFFYIKRRIKTFFQTFEWPQNMISFRFVGKFLV